MANDVKLDRNLALEVVRVTEAAALAASKLMGRGDEKKADQAAVDAMRTSLNSLAIDGTVVIGEGERDEAPMLYIGEKVGLAQTGAPKIDIASTRWRAPRSPPRACPMRWRSSPWPSMAASSMRPTSTWTRSPSAAACPRHRRPRQDAGPEPHRPGQGQGDGRCRPRGLHPRPAAPCRADRQGARGGRAHHADRRWRRVGRDRDLDRRFGHRHLHGSGGAPEGVLAAAALRAIGGQIQGRLLFRNEDEKARARKWGITDLNRNTRCSTWPRAT